MVIIDADGGVLLNTVPYRWGVECVNCIPLQKDKSGPTWCLVMTLNYIR